MSSATVVETPGRTTRSGPVRQACKDMAPFSLAVFPFGLAIGTASISAGLPAWGTLVGGLVMLAGAGQLAVVESLGRGEGMVMAVLIATLVNLRFVYYGAGAAVWFREAPLRRRLLLAAPLVDQTFLLCQQRFAHGVGLAWRQRYYLTATALLAVAFLGGQAFALRFGALVPADAGLHLAAPLAFAGMLVKGLSGLRARVAAAVSAATVVAGAFVLGPATLPAAVLAAVLLARRVGSR